MVSSSVLPQKGEHLGVFRPEKFNRAAREGLEILAHGDDPPHPPKERGEVLLLILDVDRFVVILGIDRDRQIELLRVGLGKTGIAIAAPLHRGAAAVAIAEIKIIAHPDLVAVVNDRRAGHGEEQDIEQLDLAPVVGQERPEPAANAEIDPRRRIGRVNAPHVIALFVGHHFEGEFVVVAQEHGPLAVVGYGRGLLEDVDDRKAILHLQGHEHPRHEREMEIHVRLVARSEVGDGVLRPLVRLGQEHAILEAGVEMAAQLFQIGVRFGQILAAGSIAFVKIGHGIEPETVHTHVQPEIEHLLDGLMHGGIVEIQIGLVRIKAMPVIGFRDRVPRPV